MPAFIENAFFKLGVAVANRPVVFVCVSVVVSVALSSGFFLPGVLIDENRPEKQWVPAGATALEHKDYQGATWPSYSRFNFLILKAKEEGGNVLRPKYIKHLHELNKKVEDIVIDGTALRLKEDYRGNQPLKYIQRSCGTSITKGNGRTGGREIPRMDRRQSASRRGLSASLPPSSTSFVTMSE